MLPEDLKRLALSLPETTESWHGGRPAFRVRNRVYCVLQPGEKDVILHVSSEEWRALVAGAPDAFEEISNRRGATVEEWITVHLAAADETLLRELIEDAWRRFAPKRAIAAFDQANS